MNESELKEVLLMTTDSIKDLSLIVSNILDRQQVIDMALSKRINELQDRMTHIEKMIYRG